MAERRGISDDFWDIGSLLPKKRPPVMREREPDVETVEIEIPASERSTGSLSARFREVTPERRGGAGVDVRERRDAAGNERIGNDSAANAGADGGALRLPPRPAIKRPEAEAADEYCPEGGLIKRVRIMKWNSKYSFYEQFRFDAKRYAAERGEACPEVEFFSYTPQYRQMSKSQLAYYFWWRRRAGEGEWLPASFSYVLLYIYETINLGDLIPPEAGVDRLVGVWLAYREKYHVLDKYLSEWLADYCLIHRLPPPRERLLPIMHAIMENASFREFYMAAGGGGITAETLIALSSDYDWHKSKFASESAERAELYRRHITGAVDFVAKNCGDETFSTGGMRSAVVSRDAYCGSLCAHNIKCRIDIEYLSFVRSREMRETMTELVKYSENRLRASLGIRSRLHTGRLPEKYRALADEYFDREFPEAKKRRPAKEMSGAEEAEYDAAYDALSHGIDRAGAEKIERASWASTELLVDVGEDGAAETKGTAPAETAPAEAVESAAEIKESGGDAAGCEGGIFSRLDVVSTGYLRAMMTGGSAAAREFCRERGAYEDETAARINEAAAETIGDIILENNGAGYELIEDYRDEIT